MGETEGSLGITSQDGLPWERLNGFCLKGFLAFGSE
jgi:hypothetical protein